MTPVRAHRQRGGVAILLLLAVLAVGGSYYMISSLQAMSLQRKALVQAQNAAVLNRAKQALIGYVVARASKGGVTDPEPNPGALPCPEHPWHISLPTDEGTAGPAVGIPNPGYGTANCSSIGRFPWKTIGTEKLVDASGEPLWYVVGPTWRKTSTTTKTTINSNTAGDLSVNGQQVVALIIAPGPAMSTQAATTPYGVSCSARNQARSAPAGNTLDPLDYLECYNAGALQFTTSATADSFNDQVAVVTTADLLPGVEGAVANRIEREIAPVLKTLYTGTKWNASAGQTTFPFAAPFANPTTSSFQGVAGTTQGLLPFSYSPACSPVGDPRCTASTFHSWGTPTMAKTGGGGNLWIGPDCTADSPAVNYVTCTGYYQSSSLTASFDDPLGNMANALRDFPLANHTVRVWTILYDGWSWDSWVEVTGSVTRSRRFNSSGSLSFRVTNIPLRWAWGTSYGYYYIEAQRPVPTNHALLDANDPTTGWFVRNEWYRLLYYGIAPSYAAGGTLACTTGTNCLAIANVTPAGGQRAMLILAGRSVNATARPSATLGNYLEGGNATGSFVRLPVSNATRFNDRVVIVDTN